jgi:hypothetical protein
LRSGANAKTPLSRIIAIATTVAALAIVVAMFLRR